MKIDTALYNNEKRHQLEGYFIVDTILSSLLSDVYVFLMPRLFATRSTVFSENTVLLVAADCRNSTKGEI